MSKIENLELNESSTINNQDDPISEEEVLSVPQKKLYFINEIVEWQLTQYLWTACTQVSLRDAIMSHATELIRQIIRKQGLHTIYTGQDDSSFGDLQQTAWVQIEKTLYKYRSRPHCRKCFNPDRPSDSLLYEPSEFEYGIKTLDEIVHMRKCCPKCNTKLTISPIIEPQQGTYAGSDTILYRGMSKVFNMWSQIARTVILAYIKKESRDRKNSGSYISHLGNKQKPVSGAIDRFIIELKELNKYDENNMKIIDALEYLILNDDRPYDGLISKLVDKSKLSRAIITNFLQLIKLRSYEFTDSLLNRSTEELKVDNRNRHAADFDED